MERAVGGNARTKCLFKAIRLVKRSAISSKPGGLQKLGVFKVVSKIIQPLLKIRFTGKISKLFRCLQLHNKELQRVYPRSTLSPTVID